MTRARQPTRFGYLPVWVSGRVARLTARRIEFSHDRWGAPGASPLDTRDNSDLNRPHPTNHKKPAGKAASKLTHEPVFPSPWSPVPGPRSLPPEFPPARFAYNYRP